MRGVVLGLLAALSFVGVVHGAPDAGSRAVQECLAGCDSAESDTDRATCRITCEEKQNAKEQPDVVKWEREELKGGSPDPNVARGSKTTVTEISPSGTKTRIIEDKKRGITPPRRARSLSGLAYAVCQTRCEAISRFGDRATCRLGCAEREYRRRSRLSNTPARPKPAPKASSPEPAASSRPDRACSSKCLRAASACRDRCSGHGSDLSTCELQCDQTLASCERHC
jgi:hypothetical protein